MTGHARIIYRVEMPRGAVSVVYQVSPDLSIGVQKENNRYYIRLNIKHYKSVENITFYLDFSSHSATMELIL